MFSYPSSFNPLEGGPCQREPCEQKIAKAGSQIRESPYQLLTGRTIRPPHPQPVHSNDPPEPTVPEQWVGVPEVKTRPLPKPWARTHVGRESESPTSFETNSTLLRISVPARPSEMGERTSVDKNLSWDSRSSCGLLAVHHSCSGLDISKDQTQVVVED